MSAFFHRGVAADILEEMTPGAAHAVIGRLGSPSKMPGRAYGLAALTTCKIGALLAKRAGTACAVCYATRGRYIFKETVEAHRRRLQSLLADPHRWAAAMVVKIRRSRGVKFFRWHDSGDLIGAWHLDAIEWIAEQLPDWKFWLPTKEVALVKGRKPPRNLVIRVSAFMVGGSPPNVGHPTSTSGAGCSRQCPAPKQGGHCGDCRACWNPRIKNVDYKVH